jgi:membrane protein
MSRFIFTIQEIARKLTKDNITSYAAQSCFYITLSFFPCLLVLMSLIKFLPVTSATIISIMQDIAPSQLVPMLEGIISDLYEGSSLTLTSVTAIGTLWAAGKGFMAIIRGFDVIYEIEQRRNWFVQRIMSTIYTIIFLVIMIATLFLLVFGKQFVSITSSFVPQLSAFLSSIISKKLIFFPCILLLLFMFMYKYIPNRKSSIAKEFPGALIAAIGWCLFSFFYSLYVNYSPNFSYMYGSLTTLIFALVWIYSCMTILFFGAEFNTFIEKKIINLKKKK